jgi:hypothetical protein
VSEIEDKKTEATDMGTCDVSKSFEGKTEVQYEKCSCDGAQAFSA